MPSYLPRGYSSATFRGREGSLFRRESDKLIVIRRKTAYCGEGASASAGAHSTPIGCIVTLSWFSGTFPVQPRAKKEGQTFAISFRTDFFFWFFSFSVALLLSHSPLFSLFFNHSSLFMY